MATVIEQPTYFTSLPREYYLSPEIYEREIEQIFYRQWRCLGHVSQIPAPGDYLAEELVGESVFAIRTPDNEVRAFFNVCRHRGARLCALGVGHTRGNRIVCPYHQWTYGSDGQLLNAPTIPDDEQVDYREWGLHPVQVEVWQGFIFVCLGREPLESLASLLAADDDEFNRLHPERLKEAHAVVYDVAANWKVVLENFSECYHCAATHPELCMVMDVDAYDLPNATAWEYGINHGMLRPGKQTLSMDDGFLCTKLLGEFGEGANPPEGFNTGIYIQPARTSVGFYADHASLFQIHPVSVDRTQMIQRWYVHEDAKEGIDYNVESLSYVGDITNRQDVELCELVQAGIRSRRYVPGPISRTREEVLRAALTTYLDLMDQEGPIV